jgi:spermidine/putrescine transport system substrate-binding protein
VSDPERQRFERIVRHEVTRRRLLRRGAAGALSVSALSYPAACGLETGSSGKKPESKRIAKGEIGDSLYVANWPLYLDEDHGTLKKFQTRYGTKVKYVEEIDDNNEFFGKVRQQYQRGDSGGRDVHVATDWLAAKMITLGYVEKLDHAALPNVTANLIDRLKSPPFDPKRDYSAPWQSGFAGIIYREDKVKREPKSVDDLFDPVYKGKVTMLTEMRDTLGVVAASMGFDPETASVDEFMQAIDKIGEASESGQIRGFTGAEYTKDITKGDSWVILGWSGDAVQLEADNPNIKFVAPESASSSRMRRTS